MFVCLTLRQVGHCPGCSPPKAQSHWSARLKRPCCWSVLLVTEQLKHGSVLRERGPLFRERGGGYRNGYPSKQTGTVTSPGQGGGPSPSSVRYLRPAAADVRPVIRARGRSWLLVPVESRLWPRSSRAADPEPNPSELTSASREPRSTGHERTGQDRTGQDSRQLFFAVTLDVVGHGSKLSPVCVTVREPGPEVLGTRAAAGVWRKSSVCKLLWDSQIQSHSELCFQRNNVWSSDWSQQDSLREERDVLTNQSGNMLPRNLLRSGGYDLPGVESYALPLIGYRPLSPDSPNSQSVKSVVEVESAQTEGSMKTTWYCPLDLSTVVEEEEDGIIYTVSLKPQHSAPYSPRVQTGASRSQCVKAGTEEKLVLHLLHCFTSGDSSYVTIFLCTYRSFLSTRRVLDILTDRLEDPPGSSESSPTRQAFNRAVCSVFSTWLAEYPEDFRGLEEPSCLLRLAPLLPSTELKARLLQQAEELSERALLSPTHTEESSPAPGPDPARFEPTHILVFPTALIAEQLTRIETELFVRLVPYHCLGSLWSQRDKKGREGQCWSVRATVRQFNRLANTVLASCLWNTHLRSHHRAHLLEKWISVAEECRARKNFSSLYAIVSALQSNPLHRLRRSWEHADREALKKYEELAEIFSDKDNYSHSRELLKRVIKCSYYKVLTTFYFSGGYFQVCKPGQQTEPQEHVQILSPGTVPYLGLFLTDLTMLDTAVKDRLDNGYINFDKRRREFEILAQIRLLQSSCKNCTFPTDQAFVSWYQSVPKLSEADSYRLSNQIEAAGEPGSRGATPSVVITQCSDLSSSRSSLHTDSDSLFDFTSPVNQLLSKLTKHMRSPSVSCLDVDSSPPSSDPSPAVLSPSSPAKSHRRSASCGNNPPGGPQGSGPDMRIIRIRMGLQDGNLYRSILVTSNDKTPAVISSALEKHNKDPGDAGHYELVQLLPEDKELLIPPTGNVFYAMTSSSVDFLLRRRGGNTPLGSQPISTETSATFPRIKAKGGDWCGRCSDSAHTDLEQTFSDAVLDRHAPAPPRQARLPQFEKHCPGSLLATKKNAPQLNSILTLEKWCDIQRSPCDL
ncbi:hypothetical protein WMY93_025495 [Mugilogobius chulae]|uniref:Ral guanine nucleotide dissociation stimulator-like 2 n=1 Tax=Mugilogobius chulae TaxID=88201 RepID=A0AAW0MYB6_9GOBI